MIYAVSIGIVLGAFVLLGALYFALSEFLSRMSRAMGRDDWDDD